MRPRNSISTLARLAQVALCAATAGSAIAQTTKVATVESGAVVAYIGDRAISAHDVEARLKARMFKARQEAYDLQVEGIREVAFELMQEQEAAKLGLSREAYFKREVTDKATEPKDDEVQQIFTTYRSRLPGTDDEARAEVRRVLRERNASQRAEAFKTELLSRAKLRITLDPPRLEVPVEANDPVVGGAAAAVTLVEFSDFQCPYCSRANTILKQLRGEYGDRLKMAFKQLPLGIHPQARFAAEMALCANDQGKYWEAREWLFGRRDGMTPDAAKEWAKVAALDEATFAKCLDGHLRAADIDADLATAEALAVESTPAFFVNGRMIQGARPIEQFREIIGDELARATPRDAALATP
jgi:protein-disulfide isomerase